MTPVNTPDGQGYLLRIGENSMRGQSLVFFGEGRESKWYPSTDVTVMAGY